MRKSWLQFLCALRGLRVRQRIPFVVLARRNHIFDVMALPSTEEGFGLPILESMAAGVAVVATDYSACTELLQDHGELVRVLTTVAAGTNLVEQAVIDVDDLAARIEKLYRNPELAKQHAEGGLAFARSLTWDSLIPRWLELINSVSSGPLNSLFSLSHTIRRLIE